MQEFDLITYMGSMTGYTFTREQLEGIVTNRGLGDVTSFSELTLKDRNLMLADMLFIIYTTPTSTGSVSKQHGDYSVTVGAMQITDKDNIYKLMTALYSNPEQELNQTLATYQGGVCWINEFD
jgi:hypothetical protein